MTVGWVVLAPLTIAASIWGLSRSFPDGPPPGREWRRRRAAGVPADPPVVPLLPAASSTCSRWPCAPASSRWSIAERRAARAHRRRSPSRCRSRLLPRRARRADRSPSSTSTPTGRSGSASTTPDHRLDAAAAGARRLRHRLRLRLAAAPADRAARRARAAVARATSRWPSASRPLCLAIVGPAPSLNALFESVRLAPGGAPAAAVYAAGYALSIWCWTLRPARRGAALLRAARAPRAATWPTPRTGSTSCTCRSSFGLQVAADARAAALDASSSR